MNIFHVPSWYPSENNPIYGTFIREQIQMLGHETPKWNHGVSLWGQGDPDHMLWAKHHLLNLAKVPIKRRYQSEQSGNLTHFYQPTLTWTRRVLNGNLKKLIRVNEDHFQFFLKRVEKVNVIHAQASYPGALIARYLSEKYNTPYFVSIRMSPFPFDEFLDGKGELKAWLRRPLENAKGLIAPSSSLAQRLAKLGFDNVHILPNPVDTDFFHPTQGYKSPEMTALTVGRMVPQKGIDLLLKAIHQLENGKTIKFRIGGDGPELVNYQKMAADLGVSDRITWLGKLSRQQVRDEMQKCSFYVLPSRHETFGNVLLESLACGKPVLATKCGGPEDIVMEEIGILCEISSESIAQGLEQMISKYHAYDVEEIVDDMRRSYSVEMFAMRVESIFNQ